MQGVHNQWPPAGARLSSAQLARRSFVTAQSMQVMVAAFVRNGYIERRPDPEKQRVLRNYLTVDGTEMLNRCQREADAMEQRMLAGLSQPKWSACAMRWRRAFATSRVPPVTEAACARLGGRRLRRIRFVHTRVCGLDAANRAGCVYGQSVSNKTRSGDPVPPVNFNGNAAIKPVGGT
ncbi:MarR family transcriptional regulator [Rhodococcus opacus]|nr:MarR family transcriptional regulator [Rhodococcus opacus]